MRNLELLFGLKQRVTRQQYLFWGISLMILKYLGEVALYYVAYKHFLTPLNFLSPLIALRYPVYFSSQPDFFLPAVVIWSIPFIWIGVGMSIRRAADANLSPWLGILFFVPGVNYLLMLWLSWVPTSPAANWSPQQVKQNASKVMSPLLLTIIFAFCGTLLTWLNTNFLKVYGTSLFVGSPLVLGLVQGYLINRKRLQGFKVTAGYVALSILLIHLFLLLFALEGIICLAMSLPLSVPLAVIGASFGTAISLYSSPSLRTPVLLLIVLPIMPWAESKVFKTHRDVVLSAIEINASPEKVWPNVVKFSDLPPTHDWLFKLGVAYPQRARIDGRGVGAVRHCEFSTGAFVEPITVWDEPRHLAFDVSFQPQPMKELSFYDHVDAPHLNGYFRSVHGEFRLIPTADGKTRLEGRTWYEIDMQPGWYWQNYGRYFIHRIHMRVLTHIKGLAEAS